MSESHTYVIGLDYGTDSVRAVLVSAKDGSEKASSVFSYPRWAAGKYCHPAGQVYRQHPLDYIEGLEATITAVMRQAGVDPAQVKAISVDTTGSTPVAVDASGSPLALRDEFRDNPNAMFVLWKDHSAIAEAAAINRHAASFPVNYLKYVGGIYSSEWFWAKLLHVLREDAAVAAATASWVEHCDWVPFLLTGGSDIRQLRRGVCSAGHKALWSAEFEGLPPDDFFSSLDPLLSGMREKLFTETYTADQAAGKLSPEWAKRLGLSTETLVGIGAFDAHMGAVGGQIEPYFLSRVMGTSTCDIMVVPEAALQDQLVAGICGQVAGSVIPGMVGLEAGQSAFGDAYAWFRNLVAYPLRFLENLAEREKLFDSLIARLSEEAARLPLAEADVLALDWFNGRRTPDANQALRGAIFNLDLASDAPRVFRAVVEATCFGARAIVERFQLEGVPVRGLIGLGGVARKSPFAMQMLADVLQMPIRIHRSEQTCAAGAAMFAATVAGIYPSVQEAMKHMGQGFNAEYIPDPSRGPYYTERYEAYRRAGQFVESINPLPS
jgi:L-ribulokinase